MRKSPESRQEELKLRQKRKRDPEVIRDCLECEHPTEMGTNCSECGDFFEDFSKIRKACQCKTSQVCCILCGLKTCENCAEDPLDINRRCGRYDCPPQ